jgi:hypothetical protein
MKTVRLLIGLLTVFHFCSGQGYNHQWLLGNFNFIQDPKGRMFINSINYNIITEYRKMPFKGTQGNICDANGNLLMASNGVWIANTTGDTMLNGSGINPGGITPNWPNGLPMVGNNIFIPYPDDSNKYILFHHSASINNGVYSPVNELFYSVIDITLDNGLGEVTTKNVLLLNDTINGGIAACKHANGIDWWLVVHKDSSDAVFTFLFDSNGISSVNVQSLGYTPVPWGNFAQLTFSPDGEKFIASTYVPFVTNGYMVISDFNRCTGLFSNTQVIPVTNSSYIIGLAFSPSGKYAYACSSTQIFQIDTDTYAVDTVAFYDGFISPPIGGFPTTFWNMYLAANGKIYITSGSGVQHLHEMNYPDSAGTACDVQQHAIDLVDYLHLRAVPNHPNYYLGCDTTLGCPCLTTGIGEVQEHDFKFSVSPNPTNGPLKVIYLLPQNTSGKLEIFDINGRRVYEMRLPPWSTLQQIDVSFLGGGIYNCVITAGDYRVNKKVVVVKD